MQPILDYKNNDVGLDYDQDSKRIESSNDESDLEDNNIIEDIEKQIKVEIEVDPNIFGSVSEDVTNVSKYPDEKSLMDVWKLPSGKTVAEAICDPTILHKSHPSSLKIICVRVNI
ncbi:hypothetical protein C1645_823279 [Glomus cerebriforme]|uniref:Uncharacterized protein n=1 Tax=Glomus cerebriforme TaxID=658196 RepID=A0A397T5V9_9GLOM|nr:hypothetical protein C1645_823279 [Glomus cerebriforme]